MTTARYLRLLQHAKLAKASSGGRKTTPVEPAPPANTPEWVLACLRRAPVAETVADAGNLAGTAILVDSGETAMTQPGSTQPSTPGSSSMSAQQIHDDAAWWYMGHLEPSTRRLQVWRTAPGHLVAVITQRPDDAGTSITNAVEMITTQLAAEFPGEKIELVEHHAANPALDGAELGAESFEVVTIPPGGGEPTWQPVPPRDLVARLGPEVLNRQAMPGPSDAPEPAVEAAISSEHRVEVGADPVTRLASVSCTCGWAEVVSYARDTGEPVARRLARLKGEQHLRETGHQ